MVHRFQHLAFLSSYMLIVGPAIAADFDKDVRPVLQERCVECHGAKKAKGNLRLDVKVQAFKESEHGHAIVPGDSAKSLLVQRITSQDEDEIMPPKGKPLPPAQIVAIRQWIDAGAVWPENEADRAALIDKRLQHWSVQPVKRPSVGASIDDFIDAKLKANGLHRSPEADARTRVRRLFFDLIGLPPSPEEIAKWSREPYEALVDHLLASPHYGERWARHWLDIAHYADTHGFERDQLRPDAWRYRDYVIDSLNRDKPYDQFIREQIAGDVLTPNDAQAVIATGFLAAGPWDFVGQVETKSDVLRRAARAGDLDDLVTQVITSTMGITINCARCHDHKLDPITQKEYYSLWSVFAGVKRGSREVNTEDSKHVQQEKAKFTQQLAAVRARIAKVAGEGLDLADIVGGGDGRGTGVVGQGIEIGSGNATKQKLGYHRDIQTNRLQKVNLEADKQSRRIAWVFVPDGRGEVLADAKLPIKGIPATSGHAWDAVRNGALNAQASTIIDGVDYATKGHSMLGLHANGGITFDLVGIRKSGAAGDLRFTAMVGFGAKRDAAKSLADFSVYADGVQLFQRLKMRKTDSARVDVSLPATTKTLTLIATDGGDGIGSDLLFLGDARLVPDAPPSEITEVERQQLKHWRDEEKAVDAKLKALPLSPQVYAILSDPQPPVIQVQRRGNPEDQADEVTPGAFAWTTHLPASFGGNAVPEGERRMALAKWITDPKNPLTARVLVNRLWHHHFGQGLVNTPSDFGLGGDRPSHPELLDFLADEFMTSGWSMKHIHKLIVMSQTYRQASGELRAKSEESPLGSAGRVTSDSSPLALSSSLDSSNRLLSRQNPRRLDAESLHDTVLAVSGKLNLVAGGPGFRDFNYTEAYAPIYDYITPDKPELWRRSIYRFIVRTTPHEFMSTLDCPNPANLTPARVQTTTALQALTLSNNDFMLQQARYLTERIEGERAEPSARIVRAFELCFQRQPSADEATSATRLVESQGMFTLCRMLLNANEFVYVD